MYKSSRKNALLLVKLLACCLLFSLAGGIYAQQKSFVDKTKLNGTWIFDAKASNADPETKKRYEGQDLTVSYSEPELKIIEPRTRPDPRTNQIKTLLATMVFYTDGRGETTKPYAFNQNFEVESVTKWKGDVLIRNYSIALIVDGKPGSSKYEERYSLSEDGLTLTIIKDSKSGEGARTKLIYRKR